MDISWNVQSAADCIAVQFDRYAARYWNKGLFGIKTYTAWDRQENWTLDNAGRSVANPGIYNTTSNTNFEVLTYSDAPGFGDSTGTYEGGEFWWNGTISLYDASLGNQAGTYVSPTNPAPVPGSTVEWGVKLNCEFGVGCTVAEAPASPGLP